MVTIGNAHDDLIHDAVLDYYGRRLATCSSDRTIKIFEVDQNAENYKLIETLHGHDGPIWQVTWAHPKFGSIFASCSYDGRALIWKEQPDTNTWSVIAEHNVHLASVNSVSWGPHEFGAVLLCTSSDGRVSVVDFNDDGTTSHVVFNAHAIGVNSASWAPVTYNNSKPREFGTDPYGADSGNATGGASAGMGSIGSNGHGDSGSSGSRGGLSGSIPHSERRFVTCGSDNLAKIWRYNPAINNYQLEATLEGHSDWVRDVAWSPSTLVKSYIASASQDRTVLIWSQDKEGVWQKQLLTEEKFPDVCWRCSWSLSGNILAVSGGDNRVSLWKENLQGKWDSAGEVVDQ